MRIADCGNNFMRRPEDYIIFCLVCAQFRSRLTAANGLQRQSAFSPCVSIFGYIGQVRLKDPITSFCHIESRCDMPCCWWPGDHDLGVSRMLYLLA